MIVIAAALFIGATHQTVTHIAARRQETHQSPAECGNDQGETCQSLKAYIRAADESEDSVDIALLQLSLTVAGFVGVGWTLYYAHLAWIEARKSAQTAADALSDARNDSATQAQRFAAQLKIATDTASAATKHAEVAEDTARKQLTAYVYAEKVRIVWSDEGHPLFRVIFRNTGRTPATDVVCGAIHDFGPIGFFPSASGEVSGGKVAFIGAGATEERALLVKDSETIRASNIAEGHGLYITGIIQYWDVFGIQYQTDFGFWTTQPHPVGGELWIASGHRAAFTEVGRRRE